MRKIIAFLLAVLLSLSAACAEATPTPAAEDFFAFLTEELASYSVTPAGEVCFTTDQSAYIAGMPSNTLTFSMSRGQYDNWHYLPLSDTAAVTVCCINGNIAAYILDLNLLHYVGGDTITHAALAAFAAAFQRAHPDAEAFSGDDLITPPMFDCMYSGSAFASDTAVYGNAIFSSHIFSLRQRMTLQFFPIDAYEGAVFEGQPLDAQANHDLSGASALMMEYLMVTQK